ncbi:MAG: adenylate/guanylate cyclase domain-containing protein [Deltaproteobacteria bacterium]|nr:adenylate/guanylate cyclase domain-containing protein [Deltaproteobacteria bacterium]
MSETYQYLDADMKVIDEETRPPEEITERRDARRRRWYKEAMRTKENVWTDVAVYRNGEFGTSNATPVLNADGSVRLIISSSIILSLKDGIASRLNVAENGIAFVVDGKGQLLIHPDQSKVTRCSKEGECRFSRITEIGDSALAAAFVAYSKKTDLRLAANTPRRLNYQEYRRRIDRLDPTTGKAFNELYRIDEQAKRIRLRDDVSESARRLLPEILSGIRYTYNVRFTSLGTEYLASFHPFPVRFGKPWIVGTMVPMNDFVGRLTSTLEEVAIFSLAIVLLAIVIVIVISRRILKPLARISSDMARIQNLDIDESVNHTSFFYEIDQIGFALASMKHGLKAFSKFVPVTLVKQLIAQKTGAELGGEKRRLTMMFTDIAGFTTISESMETEALLQHISEYLDSLTTIILKYNGTVDKYIGDAIMSFWGAPIKDPMHETHACRAALLCVKELNALNARWVDEGKPELHTRFGISSGEVSVGNMGSSERMNYTVLGDAVNLASRLEGINKYYGTTIMVGAATHEVVKEQFLLRPVDVVAVKGKAQGVAIYELFAGLPGDPDVPPTNEQRQCAELTERAFAAYLQQDFQTALSLYQTLGESFPNDAIAPLFRKRCEDHIKAPPGSDWTGVTHMTQK